jgi:hypothetical protein
METKTKGDDTTVETEERREHLNFSDGIPMLDDLFKAIENHQREVGLILWRMDPKPSEFVKLSERYGVEVSTLRSWMSTAHRIRTAPAGMPFSVQAQLARLPEDDDRDALLNERPMHEWTTVTMRQAVDETLRRKRAGATGVLTIPAKAKSASRARYDSEHEAKVTLTLREGRLVVDVEATKPLREPQISGDADSGVQRIEFTW